MSLSEEGPFVCICVYLDSYLEYNLKGGKLNAVPKLNLSNPVNLYA